MNPLSIRHRAFPAVLLAFAVATTASAAIEDLRITKVDPANDTVEVTNTGVDPFTAANNLPFCHLFNYSSFIPSGTSFAVGQTLPFTVTGLADAASDIWLYRNNSGFSNSANILTGMQFGAANQGRASVAVTAGIWAAAANFAPAPAVGEFLVLTGDPTLAASWTPQTNSSVDDWMLF